MAEINQSALIAQFSSVAGVEAERAKFYLESAGWNVDLALASFFDNDGGNEPESPPTPSAPQQPDPATATAPEPAHKKAAPSRFATIGSMKHAEESESSEDDHEAYYAGGSEHGGGQQILGPKKKEETPGKMVENLFKSARDHGAEEVGAGPSSQSAGENAIRFGGTGYRLGETEEPSVPIAGGAKKYLPRQIDMVLKLWSNGFSVNDGPLREFSDPVNQEFLECIKKGEVPQELIRMAKGGEVNLNMEDHRQEEYVKPKQIIKAFSGEGNTLGSPTPNIVSAAPQAGTEGGPSVSVDASQPVTSVQLRLLDGSRLVAKFNHSHTVADIRNYILSARPQFAGATFILMTTFPSKELTDESQTLQDAKLLNSVLVQRAK